MGDSQMENIGQIQSGKEPAKNKIGAADQQSLPGSQVSRGGIYASQHVDKNDQIACDVVEFHEASAQHDSSKNQPLASHKRMKFSVRGHKNHIHNHSSTVGPANLQADLRTAATGLDS